jgi:hypothetical protein
MEVTPMLAMRQQLVIQEGTAGVEMCDPAPRAGSAPSCDRADPRTVDRYFVMKGEVEVTRQGQQVPPAARPAVAFAPRPCTHSGSNTCSNTTRPNTCERVQALDGARGAQLGFLSEGSFFGEIPILGLSYPNVKHHCFDPDCTAYRDEHPTEDEVRAARTPPPARPPDSH